MLFRQSQHPASPVPFFQGIRVNAVVSERFKVMDQKRTIEELRLFDLTLCDNDIATVYKEFGILNYQAERPLLLQLSRDIRSLVSLLQRLDFKTQIGATDNGKENGPNCNDTG